MRWLDNFWNKLSRQEQIDFIDKAKIILSHIKKPNVQYIAIDNIKQLANKYFVIQKDVQTTLTSLEQAPKDVVLTSDIKYLTSYFKYFIKIADPITNTQEETFTKT